ncbi:putative G-type lectin S-receptor-like serine/threonine-protein [Sesbania bispinosa]|nr:putative G-type lectin S-receptor-like serine/threonine-protein [Sesbania bispinosa]
MGKHWSFFHVLDTLWLCILLLSEVVLAGILWVGKVPPGFEGSQMNWIDRNGKFLVSNNGEFGFGFVTTADDSTLFLLAVVHMDSTKKGGAVVCLQSFSHPTDTLLPMQDFKEGMKLISEPDSNNLTYVLEIESGNVILSSAANATWIAVLGSDGFITFSNLQSRGTIGASPTRIPQGSCSTPEPCGPYNICTGDKKCSCPSILSSSPNCKPGFVSPCNSKNSIELLKADDGLDYFALGFLTPSSKTDLIGCKSSCSKNCSCLGMFFHNSSGNCFLLDRIGSFEKSDKDSGFVSYIKVSNDGTGTGDSGNSKMQTIIVVIIVIVTLLVISGMLFVGFRCFKKEENMPESPKSIQKRTIYWRI